jgi:hypothetical protein
MRPPCISIFLSRKAKTRPPLLAGARSCRSEILKDALVLDGGMPGPVSATDTSMAASDAAANRSPPASVNLIAFPAGY